MKRMTRSQAIRAKCLDCCCQQRVEVTNCTATDCPLWRFRMGKEERDEFYVPSTRGKKKAKPE